MPAFQIKSTVLSLRPKRNRDEEFLRHAYETSRDEEFKDVVWPTQQSKEIFFTQQFNAQTEHFKSMYESLDYDIIEYKGKPIGRLVLSWEEQHLHCVDIILLPKLRKQQLGTMIMKAIVKEVDKRKITASLMFEKWKPYLEAFYGKYGFVTTKDYSAHKYMERPLPVRTTKQP
jgi:GNAT superfamily N-acetyltransferase